MNRGTVRFGAIIPRILVLLVCALPALPGQERSLLAPPLPGTSEPLDTLAVREVPVAETDGIPLRIVRFGHAGSLDRPEALNLPEEGGRTFAPYAFDWVRSNDRTVEIRERGTFARIVSLAPEGQVIIVSPGQIELLTGTVRYTRLEAGAPETVVTAGGITIRGRGRGTIERAPDELRVDVTAGRLEVFQDETLLGILGAGQSGRYMVDPDRSFDDNTFTDGVDGLRGLLSDALVDLRDGAVTGDRLAEIWEVTRRVASEYAVFEIRTDSSIEAPDVILRDIGEALRILGSHRFVPPPARGM
ncbi:MAG: hypothetical protein ACOCYQ_05735 [Alkalispirochaeta sp.]